MHTRSRHGAVAAGVLLASLGLAGTACSTVDHSIPAAPTLVGTTPSTVEPAAGVMQLWVARYDGPAKADESVSPLATSLAKVSPDGSRLFVTGSSEAALGRSGYATVSYNPATGAQLWASRYGGAIGADSIATALALSPDGSKVYATGSSEQAGTGYDAVTVAYDAVSGKQLWVARYNSPNNRNDGAAAIAVDPDGARVYVTATSEGKAEGEKGYVTVAYNSSTGAQLWASRYDGPARRSSAYSLAVSPKGGALYVTGWTQLSPGKQQKAYGTVAYNSSSGAQLWVATYQPESSFDNEGRAVAVSPDGTKVFVTGSCVGQANAYGTVAYSAATGSQLWAGSYAGPSETGSTVTSSLAVTPDGSKVFATGLHATVAYETSNGSQLWTNADRGTAIALSHDGSRVYVAGTGEGASEYATTAYRATTGGQLWAATYRSPDGGTGSAASVAVSPKSGAVFVFGISQGSAGPNYATVAYQG